MVVPGLVCVEHEMIASVSDGVVLQARDFLLPYGSTPVVLPQPKKGILSQQSLRGELPRIVRETIEWKISKFRTDTQPAPRVVQPVYCSGDARF